MACVLGVVVVAAADGVGAEMRNSPVVVDTAGLRNRSLVDAAGESRMRLDQHQQRWAEGA